MKTSIYLALVSGALFFSCSSEPTNTDSKVENQETENDDISYSITLPDNPCDLISIEMVTKHFDVAADSLEKDEYDREGVNWAEHCTYKWKKDNFEEINKANQEKLLASMKKGTVKDAVKTGMSIEQTHKHLGITNLKAFESVEQAQKYFENSHRKPSKEDMKKFDEEMEKQAEKKGMSEKEKETGKGLAGGIANNLKFESVEGIGDMASWDDLGSKLDVLVGTTQFGVKVHTGEGTEKDIEKAKAVAKDILSNF